MIRNRLTMVEFMGNSWENDGKSQWLTMVHGRYMMIYVDIFHGRIFMGCNLHGNNGIINGMFNGGLNG